MKRPVEQAHPADAPRIALELLSHARGDVGAALEERLHDCLRCRRANDRRVLQRRASGSRSYALPLPTTTTRPARSTSSFA